MSSSSVPSAQQPSGPEHGSPTELDAPSAPLAGHSADVTSDGATAGPPPIARSGTWIPPAEPGNGFRTSLIVLVAAFLILAVILAVAASEAASNLAFSTEQQVENVTKAASLSAASNIFFALGGVSLIAWLTAKAVRRDIELRERA